MLEFILIAAAAAAGYVFVIKPRLAASVKQAENVTTPPQIVAKTDDAALTARFEKHVGQFKADADAMPKADGGDPYASDDSPDKLIAKFKAAWNDKDVGELFDSINMSLILQSMLAFGVSLRAKKPGAKKAATLGSGDSFARVSNDLGAIIQDMRDKIDTINGRGKIVDQYISATLTSPVFSSGSGDSPQAIAARELGAQIVLDSDATIAKSTKRGNFIANAGAGDERMIDYGEASFITTDAAGKAADGGPGTVRTRERFFIKNVSAPDGTINSKLIAKVTGGDPKLVGKYVYLFAPPLE